MRDYRLSSWKVTVAANLTYFITIVHACGRIKTRCFLALSVTFLLWCGFKCLSVSSSFSFRSSLPSKPRLRMCGLTWHPSCDPWVVRVDDRKVQGRSTQYQWSTHTRLAHTHLLWNHQQRLFNFQNETQCFGDSRRFLSYSMVSI